MNTKDRLKKIINDKSMKLKDFSEVTGIPYSSLQNYLRGEREPNVESLVKLCSQMNINLNWLLLGKGTMWLNSEFADLSEQELNLLDKFRSCDERVQKNICVAIAAIAEIN